jgi:hypothetical protein
MLRKHLVFWQVAHNDSAVLFALCSHARKMSSRFFTGDIALTLLALGQLRHHDPELVAALVAAAREKAGSFSLQVT